MTGLREDLLDFIGRRIVGTMRNIKPQLLDNNSSRDEEACAEQEAIYLVGLSDGLTLAGLMGGQEGKRCFKEKDSSPKA